LFDAIDFRQFLNISMNIEPVCKSDHFLGFDLSFVPAGVEVEGEVFGLVDLAELQTVGLALDLVDHSHVVLVAHAFLHELLCIIL
jgi:hypothetical protein